MSGDGSNTSSYAPRSPDLSSFYSSSPTGAAPQIQPPGPLITAGYKLEPPAYAYASPHAASSLCTPSSIAPPPTTAGPSTISTAATGFAGSTIQHCPRERYTPPQFITGRPSQNNLPQPQPHLQPQPPPRTTIQPPSHGQPVPHSPASSSSLSPNMPPRKAAPPPPPAPVIEPSPVKTKFPTARIKRIMQADEEVGKVAQQTPIAVGKALELFMIQLVSKSADVAKEKGSKRVTSSMLKQVVEMDEQWDFLRDIVSRVETEKEGSKSKSKAESESDEEMVVVEEPKKKGRGGRRKKAT